MDVCVNVNLKKKSCGLVHQLNPGVVVAVFGLLTLLISFPQPSFAQEVPTVVRELQLQGTFESLIGDRLVLVDGDGKRHEMIIQVDPLKPVSLSGGEVTLSEPARIRVRGSVPVSLLETGMVVRARVPISTTGKVGTPQEIAILDSQSKVTGIEFDTPPNGADPSPAVAVGQIKSANSRRITLTMPRHPDVQKEFLPIGLAGVTQAMIETRSVALVRRGDVVNRMVAVELSNGDTIVRLIDIELTGTRNDLQLSVDQQLQLKHWKESNVSGNPRDFRSQHFLMRTDLSDRRASVLLDKLEIMFAGIADYFGRQPRQLIECYVVEDIGKWDTREWDPRVVRKVRAGEGVTIYAKRGNVQKAIVYSASNDDVVQHEAVHGFCFLAFQGTGPLWYAEGMAELGKYWQADSTAVAADPAVIGYLTSRKPQPLKEVISADAIDGEVWRAYAWRWTLCHFLANNPNYAAEFKRMGIPLMREPSRTSFEKMFGSRASQLTFEYQQFLEHLQDGLRVDLCAWQWNVKPKPIRGTRSVTKKIVAARGWQATGVKVSAGETYRIQSEGNWQVSDKASATDADGDGNGDGRLIGVVMSDFELGKVVELGVDSTFTAVEDGHLYLRCREAMSQLADNQGELQVSVSKSK